MTRFSVRAVAIAVVIVMTATSCGNATSTASKSTDTVAAPTDGGAKNRAVHKPISGVPGVSDKSIDFAVVGTKANNPLGICILDCYLDGIEAYFAYRNSQGGIYGRKLKVTSVVDDQLSASKKAALDIVSDKKAFGSFQASLLPQGWGDLNDAGVPTYTWGVDGQSAANRDGIFPSTVIQCADCTRRFLPFVAKAVGAHKAAMLGYATSSTSKLCADSNAASFKKYAKQTGVEQVYLKDNLPFGLANGLGPEVSAMKKLGVDFIATCFDLNAMKTLAQELQRQGMRDKVTLYHPNSYNQDAVLKVGKLFAGDIVESQFRPFEAPGEGSALDTFKEWMGKANKPINELAMVGWINATLAFDGLLAAGPTFDQAKVIAATNALKGWTADGLVGATNWGEVHVPVTQATRTKSPSPECGTAVQVSPSGKFVMPKFLEASKPWMCWPGEDLNWSEPTATNFK